jgi:hypothetical protein
MVSIARGPSGVATSVPAGKQPGWQGYMSFSSLVTLVLPVVALFDEQAGSARTNTATIGNSRRMENSLGVTVKLLNPSLPVQRNTSVETRTPPYFDWPEILFSCRRSRHGGDGAYCLVSSRFARGGLVRWSICTRRRSQLPRQVMRSDFCWEIPNP